jgi:hypothetical protein
MAIAAIGVGMFGVSKPAAADILVTITDGASTQFLTSASDNLLNEAFIAGSYKGSIDVEMTNFPGDGGEGSISTSISVGKLSSTNPESITFKVQVVNLNVLHPALSTNKLWTSPSGTPVDVSASADLSAARDSGGTVTTTTYFASTTSTTTTGVGAGTVSGTLADGETGKTVTGVANASSTYTLGETVTLSGLHVPSGGSLAPTFGGTSTVVGPDLASVPEPSSLVIAGIGALGMLGFGLRRRKAMTA